MMVSSGWRWMITPSDHFHGPFESSLWNGQELTQNQLVLCGTRLGDSQCQSIMLKICTEFNYIMIQLNLKFCQIWQCSSRVMKFLVMYKNLVNYL